MVERVKSPPIVQQGPLPVFFVTDIAAVDFTEEVVQFTFCTDQCWGGAEVAERELNLRLVMKRSDFERMHTVVGKKLAEVVDERQATMASVSTH